MTITLDEKSAQRADLRACMGGWCAEREGCKHYRALNTQKPSENLCVELVRLSNGMTVLRALNLGIVAARKREIDAARIDAPRRLFRRNFLTGS